MGLPNIRQAIKTLPDNAVDAGGWVIERLGLSETVWADYLESVLLTVNGWASWCAYLGWQAGLGAVRMRTCVSYWLFVWPGASSF